MRSFAIVGIVVGALCMTAPAEAQFFGVGVGGFYAPVAPPPIGGVRIRTPFFSLDSSPGYTRYSVGRPAYVGAHIPRYGYPAYSGRAYSSLYLPAYPYSGYGYSASGYGYSSGLPSASITTVRPDYRGYSYGAAGEIVPGRTLARPIPNIAPIAGTGLSTDPIAGAGTGALPQYSAGIGGGIPEITEGVSVLQGAGFSLGALEVAAETLQRSLQVRGDEDGIWREYLQPGRVSEAARNNTLNWEIVELQRRYEGVLANPQLRSIQSLRGFEATASSLRAWVSQIPQDNVGGPSPSNAPSDDDPVPTPAIPAAGTQLPNSAPSPSPESDGSADVGDPSPENDPNARRVIEGVEELPTPRAEVSPSE